MPESLSEFADDFAAFIQAFGLLRTDATPCGQPISISTAHALCELAASAYNHQCLADRLGLSKSATSRLVDQLELKGWAKRDEDPSGSDRRVRVIRLTVEGEAAATRVLHARAQRFGQLLEAIPAEDQDQVLKALKILRKAARDS